MAGPVLHARLAPRRSAVRATTWWGKAWVRAVEEAAYAESELLGLFTPGHVGADLWRLKRLTGTGLDRGDAVLSVGTDRLVGALDWRRSSPSPGPRSR